MTENRFRNLLFLCAALLVLAASLVVRSNVALKHRFPEGDEGPWLRLATRAFTPQFMTSNVIEHDLYPRRSLPHPEDNRSPLYPLLIAPVILLSHDPFAAGQIVNCACWILTCVIVGWGVFTTFGALAALLTLLFMAVSPLLIIQTAHIYPDILVACGFWFFVFNGAQIMKSRRSALGFGVLLGLLFLLKTSAVFLLPAVLFYFLKYDKTPFVKIKALLFSAGFLCLAIPWMVKNILIFGSPLYQFTGVVLFTDSLKDVFGVGVPHPTLAGYVGAHGTVFTFVIRPLKGFFELITHYSQFDHQLSVALAPLAALGIWTVRRRWKAGLGLLLFSIPYLGVMSYTACYFWVDRYLILYYVLVYALAACGVSWIAGRLRSRIWKSVTVLALVSATMIPVAYPLEYYVSGRGSEREIDAHAKTIIRRIQHSVPDSSSVLSSFLGLYGYMHDVPCVNVLEFKSAADIGVLARAYRIQSALLDTVNDKPTIQLLRDWAGNENVVAAEQEGPFRWYRIHQQQP